MSIYDFTERTKKIFEEMNNENPFDWSTEIETDIIGYRSPIEIIMTDLQTKMESDCLQAVQRYGFNVDKEELIKALNYDRDQYHKGYAEAKRIYERQKGEWINYSSTTVTCSVCKKNSPNFDTYMKMNFCPNCGADMRGGNHERIQ